MLLVAWHLNLNIYKRYRQQSDVKQLYTCHLSCSLCTLIYCHFLSILHFKSFTRISILAKIIAFTDVSGLYIAFLHLHLESSALLLHQLLICREKPWSGHEVYCDKAWTEAVRAMCTHVIYLHSRRIPALWNRNVNVYFSYW